jgi:hypothetical protein
LEALLAAGSVYTENDHATREDLITDLKAGRDPRGVDAL